MKTVTETALVRNQSISITQRNKIKNKIQKLLKTLKSMLNRTIKIYTQNYREKPQLK